MGRGGAERLTLDISQELNKRPDVELLLVTVGKSVDYEYEATGLNHIYCPSEAKVSLWGIGQKTFSPEFSKIVAEFRPDIIHTHLYKTEIITRGIYYPEAKWFSHGHDNMAAFTNFSVATLLSKRKIIDFLEKKFLFRRYNLNGGNRFIAISKDTLNFYKNTAKPYPTYLLKNAIQFERFNSSNLSRTRSSKLRLVSTGNLAEKKNQKFLIEVANLLRKQSVDFSLKLLGEGENRELLQRKITELGLEGFVFLLGNVSNVAEHLAQSDIYVHSATYEPLGLALIEAMAAGLPVITLDGKGNRDLIEEGKNGYMLFETNSELFASKILALWNNPVLYQQISEYAVEYSRPYDIQPYTERLVNLYRNA